MRITPASMLPSINSISGQRIKPVILIAVKNTTNTENANHATIDAAINKLETYNKAYAVAPSLLINTISYAQMYHIRSVIKDPIATWQKLQAKHERISEMESEVVQQLLNEFHYIETESTDETIDKFE